MWGPHHQDLRAGRRALAVLLIGLLVTACRSNPQPGDRRGSAEQVRIGDVLWYVDYDAAVEVARREDKPLWVHFGENPG